MLPNFKLAARFAKLAKQHGHKALHANNVELLTRDLGDALRRQKKAIQDPDMGVLETTYEVLPIIAEVKILTLAVSKKLELDTQDKSTIQILEEIVQKADERNSKSAKEIKATLSWTREFFAQDEVQEILKAELTGIGKPQSWMDFRGMGTTALQSLQRATEEFSRLQDFLKKAKETPEPKDPPKNDGPSA